MRTGKTAIGLMSGTSMDGIDAALLETNGEAYIKKIGSYAFSYPSAFRQKLQESLKIARQITHAGERLAALRQTEHELTLYHLDAVKALLNQLQIKPQAIDLIGFHGQTVLHRPPQKPGENGFTIQLGDGALLAREAGINTIADMRSADMRLGGNGAPLVPVYHCALATDLLGKCAFPVVFVNIGGIANVTYVDNPDKGEAAELIAFDSGPGNCLIDQWAQEKGDGLPYDKDGEAGLQGHINQAIIEAYFHLPVFQEHRRSYDRGDFMPLQEFLCNFPDLEDLNYKDGAASLAFITAKRIIDCFSAFAHKPKTLIISGGGVYNKAIMRNLQNLAEEQGATIKKAENLGLNSHFMEAEAWAYLAVRAFYHLPLTYPTTTACQKAVSGGVFYPKDPHNNSKST